jgi:hypothetical protein
MTVAGVSDRNVQSVSLGLKNRQASQAQLQTSGGVRLGLRKGFRQQA